MLLLHQRTQLAAESALRAKEEARFFKQQRSPTRKQPAVTTERGRGLRNSPASAVQENGYTEVSIHVPRYGGHQRISGHDNPHQMASVQVNSLDSHLRNPSVFQTGSGPPSPRDQPAMLNNGYRKHVAKVKKLAHITGSRSSLHSTSSDEAVLSGRRRRDGRTRTSTRKSGGNRVSGASLIPIPTKSHTKRLVNRNEQRSDSESAGPRRPLEQRRRAPVANSVVRRSENKVAARDQHKRFTRDNRLPPGVSMRGRAQAPPHRSSSTEEEIAHTRLPPPCSPPVPAVARRLAMMENTRMKEESDLTYHHHSHSTVVPALGQRPTDHQHPPDIPQDTPIFPTRIGSPPVPSVVRRLAYSQQTVALGTGAVAPYSDHSAPVPPVAKGRLPALVATAANQPNHATTSFRTSSPSMPAAGGYRGDSLSLRLQEHPPQPVPEVMQFPVFNSSQQVMDRAPESPLLLASSIERPASISPINQPLSLPAINGISHSIGGGTYILPPIHEIRSGDEGKASAMPTHTHTHTHVSLLGSSQ